MASTFYLNTFVLRAELARLEASAIFEEVLEKLGTMELVGGKPRYRTSTVIRGLSALPLLVKGYR